MKGPYLERHEIEQLDKLMEHDDTIGCWIATRIMGSSASLACDGNISMALLKKLDSHFKPYIEKLKN